MFTTKSAPIKATSRYFFLSLYRTVLYPESLLFMLASLFLSLSTSRSKSWGYRHAITAVLWAGVTRSMESYIEASFLFLLSREVMEYMDKSVRYLYHAKGFFIYKAVIIALTKILHSVVEVENENNSPVVYSLSSREGIYILNIEYK